MVDYSLPTDKLAELRAARPGTRDKRNADPIKAAVLLLATGWTTEQVAEVLQVNPYRVRNHFKRYRPGGVKARGHMDAVHPQHNPVIARGWIKLVFLPPYAPILNLIECLWKFFKKKVLYNRDYESFDEFRSACEPLFLVIRKKYRRELRSLLTKNSVIAG